MSRFGVLNVNKPSGVTSRDVVDCVARLARPEKAGHAGTLDPLACGVLVIGVGRATRLVDYVQQMRKHYTGTFRLGCRSPSDDVETEVEPLTDPHVPALDEIVAEAGHLIGKIMQRPPTYSALKVAGRRSYHLARAGEQFELKPREVEIHRIDVVRYAYPEFTLEIECSSGTYVRAVGRDLAARLGTAAVMTALERTAVGDYHLADAVTTDDLERDGLDAYLLPAITAVAMLPKIELTKPQVRDVLNGRLLERPAAPPGIELAAVDHAGQLVSILRRADGSLFAPERNFPPST